MNALVYDVCQPMVMDTHPHPLESENDTKSKQVILCWLYEFKFMKVSIASWLRTCRIRQIKYKKGIIRWRRRRLKLIKTIWNPEDEEEDNIASSFLCVNETMNIVKELSEDVDEVVIVQKVLSFPLILDSKVFTLEEMKDLDTLKKEILIAYEMRIEDNSSQKEVTFKALRKGKNKVCEPNESSYNDKNEEEAIFMRKIKKGSMKYQGKFAFKWFVVNWTILF